MARLVLPTPPIYIQSYSFCSILELGVILTWPRKYHPDWFLESLYSPEGREGNELKIPGNLTLKNTHPVGSNGLNATLLVDNT